MENNNANEGEEKKDTNVEGEEAKSSDKKEEGTDGGGSDTKSDKKADDTTSKDEKKDEKADDINLDEEPEVRKKSKFDYILERKNRQIKKLSKEKKDEGGGEEDEKEDGEETDEDDEVDPMDREIIGKEVSKHLKPILEKQELDETKAEVSTFITTNPDFKPFEAKILKFASHPSRKNMPIKAIAYEVAGDKLMQIGAERAKKANAEAKEHESGGGGKGGDNNAGKSVNDMSVDEFKAHQQEVLRRRSN